MNKSGIEWVGKCACGAPSTKWCAGCDTEFCDECAWDHEDDTPCEYARHFSVDSKAGIDTYFEPIRATNAKG